MRPGDSKVRMKTSVLHISDSGGEFYMYVLCLPA